MSDSELLVVVGPTASGKTALAIEMARALAGEVVSADSVQVYRHFDVGTGKPTSEELACVPHHLIDVLEPDAPMDAARWAALADDAISSMRLRGKQPIVCGGTFLWIRALLFGLAPAPPADETIRARHRQIAVTEGRAALHADLTRVDAVTAARLNPNDFVRVSRALEVYELTRTPLSQWHRGHGFREPRYRARLIGVERPRPEQESRIRERVAAMLAAGWVDEVRTLLRCGYRETRPMKSVGYRQVAEALDQGLPSVPSLSESIDRATRIFARRQRTWLRDQPVVWVRPGEWRRALGEPWGS